MSTRKYHPAAVALRAVLALANETEREVAGRLRLNLTDYRALSALSQSGPMTVGNLAAELGTTAATTTAIVNRLQTRGYAERLRGEGDRRHVHVTATAAASRDIMHLMRPLMDATNRHIESLPGAQQDAVADFLQAAHLLMKDHLHTLSTKDTA
ncbi:MarR family transcriptional regulator [Arthrobacter sp. OY3WO11]|uniref:MarR family winged helix-turn-helix transcriptional regulator n=1 Tax=Arthrobacter sp. OY3WO11 TaxID=1835723 RepID=UPI0007CFD9B6|nr:MarR family transcriptional regulator [Arthrobacter sp. OY3WO11]OAE00977.1 MarR family transcriptional regulator [Arthrobacter sp. OY3WO11]